ncbi:MarR family winged helix-turn-helix transcriptional regulator [Sulfobacillus harzensis]|uniref:MarR family transcriptional regulator n=1 Tax=Sulfobacillus harzensis TaxID=2729629 RepID=A0A7Y0L5C9_9FIRM|nr:MarR family transcriptional regulator [Sulfobacillus harzensis]NMP22179.1 MarR family transcriptional regulator [Sulfobacillus harzensis]
MEFPEPLTVEDAITRVLDMQKRAFAFFIERRGERQPEAPTRFQTYVLRMVQDHDGISISKLAHSLSVSAPTASQLVNGLVDKGYLSIALSPLDRRRHEVHITASGRHWLHQQIEKRLGDVKRVLEEFSPEDRAELIRLLDKAISLWQVHSSEGSSMHGS